MKCFKVERISAEAWSPTISISAIAFTLKTSRITKTLTSDFMKTFGCHPYDSSVNCNEKLEKVCREEREESK